MIAYIEDRLPVTPTAVPLARHALAVSLLPELDEDALDTVLLLTTEAVSRAVGATAEPWRLRVDVEDEVLRVTVRYRPRSVEADADDELRDVILGALSAAWGVERSGEMTTLWFEVA